MDLTRMTMQEALIYGAILNAGIGFVLGLVPLIVGFMKRKRKLGFFGFVGSILGGAILGLLLAVPVAAIFTWLIVRPAKPVAASNDA